MKDAYTKLMDVRLLAVLAAVLFMYGCGTGDDADSYPQDTNQDAGADAASDSDTDSDSDSDTDTDTDTDTGFEELRASIDANEDPDVTQEDLDSMKAGNVDLSMKLLRALAVEKGGNLAVSAFSIRSAFAMLLAAAKGETETEIATTLGFLEDQSRTHNAMNYYNREIMKRNLPETEYDDPVIISTANRMFVRPDKNIGDEYLEILAYNYDAGMYLADFGTDPEGMRKKMNAWVEEQTYDRIKNLFPEGSIISDTAWVLVNAVYLKAPWMFGFEKSLTKEMPFTLLDDSEVKVPTMHNTEVEGYYGTGDGYKIVDVPLRGNDLSMTFILPDQGGYDEIEESLDDGTLDEMLEDLEHGPIEVYLPRFKVETGSLMLNDILIELGMVNPFGSQADFSGFGPDPDYPGISFVYHSVFVAADEIGVEAAAATGIGGNDSASMPMMLFDAHRPFIFILRDRPTGLALFTGRVLDPSK